MSKSYTIKSHQHDCLTVSWIRITIDTGAKVNDKVQELQPYIKNYRQLRNVRVESFFPTSTDYPIHPILNDQPWKHIHRNNIIYMKQKWRDYELEINQGGIRNSIIGSIIITSILKEKKLKIERTMLGIKNLSLSSPSVSWNFLTCRVKQNLRPFTRHCS